VDFLLCDTKAFHPSFGVEIVKPIAKQGMREADKYIAEVFADAGIPLVHVPSLEKYDPNDLIPLFKLALVKSGKPDDTVDSVPNCPICGKMMVLRIHRNGSQAGRTYYGCIDNPRCAGAVPIP
jgi:hypothetical protein